MLPVSKKMSIKKALVPLICVGLMNVSHAELIINSPQTPSTTIVSATTPAVISTVLPSHVQRPSNESVSKLMQVLHVDDVIEGMLIEQQQLSDAVSTLPTSLPKTDNKVTSIFSRKVQQQMQQVLEKYSSVFAKQIDVPKQRQAMLTAYQTVAKQRYTQAEVNALIAFYDNPMGQQILQKQNLVNSDFLQAVMPMMAGDPAALQQALPTLQKDIENIFK